MIRSRPAAFAALGIGALLGLVAAAQPWWRAEGQGVQVALTGSVVTAGLGQALPVVAAVGVLLALALRARGRQLLGIVLALVGAGMVLVGVRNPAPTAETVRARLREVSLADQVALTETAWPLCYAFAGVLVLGGALVLATQARRWAASAPVRSDRFAATTAAPGAPTNPGAEIDPLLAWQSLDAGVDPTVGPRADPDVHSGEQGDTMGNEQGGNEQGRDQTTTHP